MYPGVLRPEVTCTAHQVRVSPNLTPLVMASVGALASWTEDSHVRGDTEVCKSTGWGPGYVSQPPLRVLLSLAYK